MTTTYVIVARHGERLDYVMRDAGQNWLTTATRPWDPPLSSHGKEQGQKLGRHLVREIKRLNLPPLVAVYSSPFLRCRQTAVEALRGAKLESEKVSNDDDPSEPPLPRAIGVELGLAESINESWYRSWSLPGSNGTWGFRTPGEINPETLHPASKQPIQPLLDWKATLKTDNGSSDDISDTDLEEEFQSRSTLDTPYCFYPPLLESRQEQRNRMLKTVQTVAEKDKTVLLVSHGGPVTHLYEELTGNPWHVHGESSYCCYSIYRKVSDEQWETVAVNQSSFLHEKIITERHVSDIRN